MSKKLIIIGAGGHGKVIADIAIKNNAWYEILFLDDNINLKDVMGIPVAGKIDNYSKYVTNYEFIVAIGDNYLRKKILNNLDMIEAEIATLTHPNAVIASDVIIGKGTVVMAGAIINSSTKIGKGCIINTGASVDHDNTINDFVHISPGVNLAGNVVVGENTWIGLGSSINNNVFIEKNCIIGAGAVVIDSIMDSGIYVGIPAKRKN